jgi:glycine cleavage system H protein
MNNIPEELRYTRDHLWIMMDDEFTARCGITDYAQEQLSDVVYIELPEENNDIQQGEQVAMVESMEDISNVYAPLSGRIVSVNRNLESTPENINLDPYGQGWIFRIDVKDSVEIDELMTDAEYREYLEYL